MKHRYKDSFNPADCIVNQFLSLLKWISTLFPEKYCSYHFYNIKHKCNKKKWCCYTCMYLIQNGLKCWSVLWVCFPDLITQNFCPGKSCLGKRLKTITRTLPHIYCHYCFMTAMLVNPICQIDSPNPIIKIEPVKKKRIFCTILSVIRWTVSKKKIFSHKVQ